MPAIGPESLRSIVRERQLGRPINGDVVVVVDIDELAQPKVPS
ncbi:unannotated protein [freshwater metagenome]|uniref:Unannotated protein n=1 Tax=freshwater metagenome TaxID=449393 RepID=A0A6J7PE93_9ZZZZ